MKFFLISLIIFRIADSHGYETNMTSTKMVDDHNYITVDYQMNTQQDENLEGIQQTIGLMFYPHSTVKVVKKINSKVFASANYDIGEFGLRNIADKFLNLKAKKHFILAGGSFVFGDGNNDEDTVVAKMSASLKSYHVYNFGYCGGSPNYTLALMENYPWSQLVNVPDGLFVYYFNVESEMQGVIGSWQITKWNQGLAPYYKLDWDGHLVRQGNFNDRFFLTAFYKWLGQFSWIEKVKKDFPSPGSSDIKLVTQMFKYMKQIYLEQFPNGKFVIAIKSLNKPHMTELIQKLTISLREEKIDFIEMSPELLPNTTLLPLYDSHLNGAGNSLMASEMKEKLEKNNFLTREN